MSKHITPDLKQMVIENDHIDALHFTAAGACYLNVHEHQGSKYGHIAEQQILGKDGKPIRVKTPIIHTKITESVSRDVVMNSKATEESPIMQENGQKFKK